MFRKLAIIFVICLIALFFVSDNLVAKLAKNGIETYAPDIIGAKVSVDHVDVSLSSGSLTIKSLLIGNPKGFVSNYALTLDQINIEADIASFFTDTVLIKKLHIASPNISFERKGGTTNIQELQKNAARSAQQSTRATTTAKKPSTQTKAPKKVIIESLIVNDTKVTPSIGDAKIAIQLPNIRLKNIGKESGGITFSQAANQILEATTRALKQVDLSKLLNINIDLKNTNLKDLKKQFKQEKGVLKDSLKGLLR